MAVVNKKTVSVEKMFECDRCKKTKSMSLSLELTDSIRQSDRWYFSQDNDDCLCPDCLRLIIQSWYTQQNIDNFQLSSSIGDSQKMPNKPHVKRSKKVVA